MYFLTFLRKVMAFSALSNQPLIDTRKINQSCGAAAAAENSPTEVSNS
jgi:hypothetical protein